MKFCSAGRTPGSASNKPTEASYALVSSLRHSQVDSVAFHKGWEQPFIQWRMLIKAFYSAELPTCRNLVPWSLLPHLWKYSKLYWIKSWNPWPNWALFWANVQTIAGSPFQNELFSDSMSSLTGIDEQLKNLWGIADKRVYSRAWRSFSL